MIPFTKNARKNNYIIYSGRFLRRAGVTLPFYYNRRLLKN